MRLPSRPVGRPSQPFKQDPDRYAVALLDAMLALEMGSERACALTIAAWQVGRQLEARPGRITWAMTPTLPGAKAATLVGRANTMRGKQRRPCDLEDASWRTAMASAFMLALAAKDPEAAKPAVILRAKSVGENEFATRIMLPMLIGAPPRIFA